MRFGFLPTLNAVLRKGSFAAAAQELGLTPSAVSQQMRLLEQYFGHSLFDRSKRTVQATPFAREVMVTVNSALVGLETLRDRRTPAVGGKLRLGVINSAQASVVPPCLMKVRERYPTLEIYLNLKIDTSHRLLEAVKSGDIDAAVVVRPGSGGSRKLRWFNLQEEPFVMLAPPQSENNTSMRELANSLPWLRYNSASSGGLLASSFVRRLVPALRPSIEIMSTDTIVAMVSAGVGFSVIPRPRAPLLHAYPVTVFRLDRQMPQRQIALVCRAADVDNRRVGAVTSCLRETYAEIRSLAEG